MAAGAMATVMIGNVVAQGWILRARGFPRRSAQALHVFRGPIRPQSSSSSAQEVPVEGGDTERTRQCLNDLAETLVLPQGFLSKLPNDLKVDLDDAAFALSKGPVNQECGERAGELIMELSRALEQADTQSAAALASKVPSLQDFLPSDPYSNAALGKRLQAAGRYLATTGEYGNGELQKLSKALLAAGEALSLGSPPSTDSPTAKADGPIFKFGDLQVQLTAPRAYIGAAIAFAFGIVCWELTSGLQQTNALDSAQYANDNSFTVATSLRGILLIGGYSCTALSAISMAGLLALASQLGREDPS